MAAKVEDDESFVVFTPRYLRYAVIELWGSLLIASAMGAVIVGWGTITRRGLVMAAVVAILGVLFSAIGVRNWGRITVGRWWVQGPTGLPFESTTLQLETIDRIRSGFQSKYLRLEAIGGRGIVARLAWYSRTDVEEMRRLLRRYCAHESS